MAESTLAVRPVWTALPDVEIDTPILAVAEADDGSVWVGGVGGVARVGAAAPEPGLRMSVSALAAGVVAGGADGLARRAGRWEPARSRFGPDPVTAIVAAGSGWVAATLGGGIARSADGRTWLPSNFGLEDRAISALAAGRELLFAGTSRGVFSSRTGGRSWKPEPETGAVSALASTGGSVVAGLENGEIRRREPAGWVRAGRVPEPVDALAVLPDGTLLAGTSRGIHRSVDNGQTWRVGLGRAVYCLTRTRAGIVYAGTGTGLAASADAGRSWHRVAVPPTHDLDRLHELDGRPLLTGARTGAIRLGPDGEWAALPGIPFPLTGAAITPSGALLVSGPAGLAGAGGRELVPGSAGRVGSFAFAGRDGWAAPDRHGEHLLRSTDGGASWRVVPAPFGALPVAGLWAAPGVLVAAIADPRNDLVRLWISSDGADSWRADREFAGCTARPPGSTVDGQIVLGLGHRLVRPSADRIDVVPAEGRILAIAGSGVLTTTGLWDPGLTRREDVPPGAVDLSGSHLLLTGGRVRRRMTRGGRP